MQVENSFIVLIFLAGFLLFILGLAICAFPIQFVAASLWFLAAFSAGLLFFWVAKYRQTSREIEMLREEIEREIHGRNESEHDSSEGSNRRGHKRK